MKRDSSASASVITWLIIGLCCALPVLWMLVQISLNRAVLVELKLDAFRLGLLGRTILYNLAVALVATVIAIPAAIALGRGRGIFPAALWVLLPIGLLLPSLVLTYGWSQLVRMIVEATTDPPRYPIAAGFLDVARCIWSLATWLWPIPAIIMGLALRRSDAQVQQQALLDNALGRVVARELLGPTFASAAIVMILAMQEFAVYEPTGISVVATEVRMVFETGAFSSPQNPITQPMSQSSSFNLPDQRARAAAAVATALPLIAITAFLALIALVGARKLSTAEHVETGSWPRALDAPRWVVLVSWLTVALTLVVPIVSLILSLKRPFVPARVWGEFGPQTAGSLMVSSIAGSVALALGLCAAMSRVRGVTLVALISFLIGGQLIAIALIRLYNRPALTWAYAGVPVIVMAYLSRFAWIALVAANATWTGPWRALRDMAALDGATRWGAARHVIWPLAWPLLAAAGACVMILALTEVPATVLIAPQRPQVLIPMLMTWVHMLRYDAMIEASLLMALMVVVLGSIAVGLARVGQTWTRPRAGGAERALRAGRGFDVVRALPIMLALLVGCERVPSPDAVWLETGNGPAQTVYPRAIAYSPADDTFFICDRQARIQHLDRRGRFLAEWQTPQWLQGKPVGLTVGPDGNLYVPDTHYHRVLVYKPNGEGPIRAWGSRGTGPGQFIYPTDIAFDSAGRVFVSEYGDHDRIQVFDTNGTYLYEFGAFGTGPGEFSRPQSILIDDDLVYVADACNHRICVFRTDGTFVRNFGQVGSGLGEFRFPYGLAMDSRKNLVVCEFGNNRVQKVDSQTGQGIATWGHAGREPGQLAYPWAVAVDKSDRVVAVDAGNNRLQVFDF